MAAKKTNPQEAKRIYEAFLLVFPANPELVYSYFKLHGVYITEAELKALK